MHITIAHTLSLMARPIATLVRTIANSYSKLLLLTIQIFKDGGNCTDGYYYDGSSCKGVPAGILVLHVVNEYLKFMSTQDIICLTEVQMSTITARLGLSQQC
jgi:hypothetical protein